MTKAGGRITDLRGQKLTFRGKSSICAVSRGIAREDYLPPVEWQM